MNGWQPQWKTLKMLINFNLEISHSHAIRNFEIHCNTFSKTDDIWWWPYAVKIYSVAEGSLDNKLHLRWKYTCARHQCNGMLKYDILHDGWMKWSWLTELTALIFGNRESFCAMQGNTRERDCNIINCSEPARRWADSRWIAFNCRLSSRQWLLPSCASFTVEENRWRHY
jgi:hypothetical protein